MRCGPSDEAAGRARWRDLSLRLRGAWTIISAAFAITASSCGGTPAEQPPVVPAAPAAAAAATSGAPHGDHNPHHGGIVMMKGDNLHYEVVVDPVGRAHHVYFTDAVREDLPAAVASDVVLTVRRPGVAEERVPLQIDDAGESWVGAGRPISGAATVRVAFSIQHESYWIDLPFTASK
jgi:hypothetical protein